MGSRSRGAAAKVLATLRMYIPAGKASPSPPLGPALGQVPAPDAGLVPETNQMPSGPDSLTQLSGP